MRFLATLVRSGLLLALIGASFIGCSESTPTGPTGGPAGAGASLTLAPGQTAVVPGTPLTLRFVGVGSDSRCPADAFCIHLGEAVAAVDGTLASQGASRVDLRTSDAGRIAHVGSYRIELVTLQPYPFSSRTIDPAAYRVTLRVDAP